MPEYYRLETESGRVYTVIRDPGLVEELHAKSPSPWFIVELRGDGAEYTQILAANQPGFQPAETITQAGAFCKRHLLYANGENTPFTTSQVKRVEEVASTRDLEALIASARGHELAGAGRHA